MDLFDLMVATYLKLGQLTIRKATGGTTTTVKDSTLSDESEDDDFMGSPVFLTYDALGTGVAPQGEWTECTDYSASTGTFTVSPAFTVAPAADDYFGYGLGVFPLFTMIELCNQGLKRIGPIPLVDTSLTSDSAKRIYSLPVVCKFRRPLRIAIANDTDTDDYGWEEVPDWDYQPGAAGSVGKINLARYPLDTKTIAIWYEGTHPDVRTAAAYVSESLEYELATVACALTAVEWYNRLLGGTEDFWLQTEARLKAEFDDRILRFSPQMPLPMPQLFLPGDEGGRFSRLTGDELMV